MNVGASIASTKTTLALAEAHPFMYAAVGVHPNETAELTDADMKMAGIPGRKPEGCGDR